MINVFKKINIVRVFLVIFTCMFISYLFLGIRVFAITNAFKINSAIISDKSSGVTGDISSITDSEVDNNITFYNVNDYATFTLEIESEIDRDITIIEITDNNTNSYIDYEYDKHENEDLSANGSFDFIVKAIYKNELTDTSIRNQSNSVKFFIKYLDNGAEQTDVITINPRTGDNIGKSILLLIISSTGLIICIALNKKNKQKNISKVSVLILTSLVLSPIVVNAAEVAFSITLNSSIKLYDKLVVTLDDGTNQTTKTIEHGGTIDSLPTPSKTGYTFVKWVNEDDTDFDITEAINEDKTIKAKWDINSYTITFDTDGGSAVSPINQEYNTTINAPTNPKKSGYRFDGWSPELPSKMPAENITVTAQWTYLNIICKRATILTHETCQISGNSSEGCRGDNYNYGDQIVYGSLISSSQLSSGNALDCNVDGTGYNQRFYYLRTLNDNAVLISNMNYEGDSGQGYNVNYVYADAHSKLPRKSDQWTNLPITFTHDGDSTVYAARFITIDDLKATTGKTNITANNSFNSPYNFIFENTSYALVTDPEHRSTVWIEPVGTERHRYHKKDRNVDVLTSSNYDTSKNSVRPVIEVPLDKIDMSINEDEYTIMYNLMNGTYIIKTYSKGSTVNDLPIPPKDGYDFIGWYTDETFTNKFSNGDTINNDTMLYAKWLLTNSVVEYNNTGYSSFANAFTAIKNSNEAKVKLLKDTSEKISIASNRNIVIDLNGHTITNSGDNQVIYNQGTVKVMNGTITTTASTKAAIDNSTTLSATIDNVTINANGNRSAVYNSKGTVIITGGSTLTISNNIRPTVMNLNTTSTMQIIDATITSNEKNPVDNNNGILIIGSDDSSINASTPVIIGGSYGVVSNTDVTMYDGIIKGKIAPAYNGKSTTGNNPITYSGGAENNNRIIASESGYTKTTGIDGEYKTLYLIAE